MPFHNNNLMTEFNFSEENQEKVLFRIWELLKKQSQKYNGYDSTSMTVEKAQDILESLLYTISVAIDDGASIKQLLDGDTQILIDRGQRVLKEKKISVKVKWKLICQDLPRIKNVYYMYTINNLGLFFDKYEIYYESHHIPISIDYLLLCPISEQIKGISYIEEYLYRIQIENDFLNCFDIDLIIRLYNSYIQDYEETLFNLCEPVMTNAIGLAIIQQDIHKLNITTAQRNTILNNLINKSKDEIRDLVDQSVQFMCNSIGLTSKNECYYFSDAAKGLSVIIFEAVKHRDLSHVFISFDTNRNHS